MNERRKLPWRLGLAMPASLSFHRMDRSGLALTALCLGMVLALGLMGPDLFAAGAQAKGSVNVPANAFATKSKHGKG